MGSRGRPRGGGACVRRATNWGGVCEDGHEDAALCSGGVMDGDPDHQPTEEQPRSSCPSATVAWGRASLALFLPTP
jgi:hypothetical protein